MNLYRINTHTKQGDEITYKMTALSLTDAMNRLNKKKCHGETTIERISYRQSDRVPKKHTVIID